MIHNTNKKVMFSLLMLGSFATITTNISAMKLSAVNSAATEIAAPVVKTVAEKAKDLFKSGASAAAGYWDQFAVWAAPKAKKLSKEAAQAWKAGQASIQEKTVDVVKHEQDKFKEMFPRYLRDALYGALATAIASYAIAKGVEYLIVRPFEAAKNKFNYAKKVIYVAQAQELLKDENILENIMKKVFQMGLALSIPEQIAILGLYLMDEDQELTTEQLMAEDTVDKIVSGEVSLDKSQLKKLIQSIIKQNKQASEDQESDDEETKNTVAAASKTTDKKVASEEKHDVKNTAPAAG